MGKMNGIYLELLSLSGESTIPVELLAEDPILVEMVGKNIDHAELLDYINENW